MIEFQLYNYDGINTYLLHIRNNTYKLITDLPNDILYEFEENSKHLKWLFPAGGPYMVRGHVLNDIGMKITRMVKTEHNIYLQFEEVN